MNQYKELHQNLFSSRIYVDYGCLNNSVDLKITSLWCRVKCALCCHVWSSWGCSASLKYIPILCHLRGPSVQSVFFSASTVSGFLEIDSVLYIIKTKKKCNVKLTPSHSRVIASYNIHDNWHPVSYKIQNESSN